MGWAFFGCLRGEGSGLDAWSLRRLASSDSGQDFHRLTPLLSVKLIGNLLLKNLENVPNEDSLVDGAEIVADRLHLVSSSNDSECAVDRIGFQID